jgi:hypothetical protein
LINEALHIALFALAGGFQSTHVTLELRARDKRDSPWEMEESFWMAADGQHSEVVALATMLTTLEVGAVRGVLAAAMQAHDPADWHFS